MRGDCNLGQIAEADFFPLSEIVYQRKGGSMLSRDQKNKMLNHFPHYIRSVIWRKLLKFS